MKTANLLAALLLAVSSNLMADDVKCLTITYSDTEQSIPLPVIQKITFEEGYVVVTTTEGKHSYPISILDRMTFTVKDDADAIKALPEKEENISFEKGILSVKGNGLLCVYNTSGALVSIANVKEGANVSLDNLPAGVYVVRMAGKTIKVRK